MRARRIKRMKQQKDEVSGEIELDSEDFKPKHKDTKHKEVKLKETKTKKTKDDEERVYKPVVSRELSKQLVREASKLVLRSARPTLQSSEGVSLDFDENKIKPKRDSEESSDSSVNSV